MVWNVWTEEKKEHILQVTEKSWKILGSKWLLFILHCSTENPENCNCTFALKTAMEMRGDQTPVRASRLDENLMTTVAAFSTLTPAVACASRAPLSFESWPPLFFSLIQIVTATLACQKVVVPHVARLPAAVFTAGGCYALLLSRLASDFPRPDRCLCT